MTMTTPRTRRSSGRQPQGESPSSFTEEVEDKPLRSADRVAQIRQNDVPDPKPRRINVAVTPEAICAIESIMARERVSLTEAVRRLLSYGNFVYRSVREEDGELTLRTSDGESKDVVFV